MNQKIDTQLNWDDWGEGSVAQPNQNHPKKTGRKGGALWGRANLVGLKFNMMTVISAAPDVIGKNGGITSRWNCRCDCGSEKIVQGTHLKQGAIKSCGCFRVKTSKKTFTTHGATAGAIHGAAKDRTYRIWCGMKTRCSNPNQKSAENYLNKGISVCERWKNSYEDFILDMGKAPDGLTLDRMDNNLGYCKENCRWATYKQQANNTSKNRIIEHDGIKLNVSQWAEKLAIPVQILYSRLHQGFDDHRALTQPVKIVPKRKLI